MAVDLKFISYNCRGYNKSKDVFIRSLLDRCGLLFLQEHWLSDSQLHLLNSVCNNFTSVGVSGFGKSDVLSGRPYGGCSILWRKDITSKITVIDTGSNRVCAVLINVAANLDALCLNVYLPYV